MEGDVSLRPDRRVVRGRDRVRRALCAAVVASCAMAWTVAPLTSTFAQTGSESPNTLPDTKIAPAPAEESSSTAATPESPAAAPSEAAPEMAAPEMAAPEVPPPPPVHHKTATHHRPAKSVAGVSATEVEPVHARVKLKEDAWVFTRPTKWSKHVERVHADKYVEITGTTRNYLRVKLKSGQDAYLPTSAVEMTRPADKIFQLTSNAPVLSEPSHWGKKLSEVHKGHNVHVVGISLNYMKIRMKDGVEGYIPTTALE